jgi:hypothetical protein
MVCMVCMIIFNGSRWCSYTSDRLESGGADDSVEVNAQLQLIVAVLSASIVGPGDGKGLTNVTRLMGCCRSDGLVLKADRPAVPIDAVWTHGGPRGELSFACACSGDGRTQTTYFLAADVEDDYRVTPRDLQLSASGRRCGSGSYGARQAATTVVSPKGPGEEAGRWIVYDWASRRAAPFSEAEPLQLNASSKARPIKVEWSLSVVAPVMRGGWAVIGEPGKIVGASSRRLRSADTLPSGNLAVVALGVPKELVEMCAVAADLQLLCKSGTVGADGTVGFTFVASTGSNLRSRNHSGDAERLTPTLEIFPATSKKVPLTTRSLQFTATKSLKDVANSTQYFLIETIPPPSGHDNSSYDYTSMSLWLCASTHSPSVVVAPLVGTISDGPFPAMNVVGSVQIRVSAYAAKNGQRLGTSVPHTIYFDLRYSTLRHQLQVERGAHNRVHLTAVPEDITLGKLTQSATFDTFSLSKSGKWTPNHLYKQNHTQRNGQTHYTFQFGSPGIVFVGMVYSTNAFDLHATRAAPSTFDGIFAQPAPLDKMNDGSTVFNPIAVVVPFSNGTVPQPPHSFTGQMIKLEPVPGDLQLCLKHRKLTVLGGPPATGVNFLKLCGVDASAKHMALKLAEGFSVLPAPGSHTDRSTQNVSKLADNVWMISGVFFESVQLALKADASLINVTTQIQLAIFGGSQMPAAGSTAWQNVQVSVVPWPAVNTPKHLVTAITDAPAAAIQDMVVMDKGERILGLYRRLGMSVFPTQASNAIDPRNPLGSRFYFPANRTSPDWAALRYGVEHGTFGNGFNGDGLFCLASGKTGGIGCPVDPNSSALKGLSPEAKAAELLKWENAVAFHNLTGQLDLSYDGFLLNNSFENLNLVTSLVKPDYVFTDAEHFPSLQIFTDTIGAHTSVAFASAEHCAAFSLPPHGYCTGLSANAQARRRPGESDCSLAKRISNEFLQAWMHAMNSAVNCFYGDVSVHCWRGICAHSFLLVPTSGRHQKVGMAAMGHGCQTT